MKRSLILCSALLFAAACSNDVKPQEMRVSFPQVDGLTFSQLSADAKATIRADITIEGLDTVPLEIDSEDGSGYARIELPAGTNGTFNVKIEYFGANDRDSEEVLLFRSEYETSIKEGEVNSDLITQWVSSGGLEFDLNRNNRSNWQDLGEPNCDPAEVPSPVVVAPMTVSFESGIDLGGFTRAFFVVENRSAVEDVHFSLDVQMAPGVTVAPLDALLEEGSRALTTEYSSRTALDESGNETPLAPNGQRVFAVTFAPTSREFMSGAVSLQVETQTCNVNYGEIVRVLGNPDGAVPDSPDDYEAPQVADVQIVGYNGEFEVLDARTLFSLAPALAESDEQVGSENVPAWAIDDQDVDYAYLVAVPANYQFALVLDNLQADLDLVLYKLSGTSLDSLTVGRDAEEARSANVGLAPESVSFEAGDQPTYLLLAVDRISPSDDDGAKAEGDRVATFSAAMFSVPEFLAGCGEGAEDCNSPISATTVCPDTYATSFACGGASSSSNITLRGKQFQDGAVVTFGSQVATCGDVTQGEDFDSIECSVPTVDDVGVEGSTVSISLYNPDGQVATLVDGFTYLPPAPTLYSITPAEGPLSGGTPISIRGISFTSLPDMLPMIEFVTASGDAFEATDIDYRSSQQLTALVPECPGCEAGLVAVKVTNPDGQVSINELDFSYIQPDADAPAIETITPLEGSRLGGTLVTVSGSGFATTGIVAVRVGGTAGSNVDVLSATSLTFRTPAANPGQAVVQVVNPDGQVATADQVFTYQKPNPDITSVTPSESPLTGGIQISIWGSDFTPGMAVAFEGANGLLPASNAAVVSSSLITCIVPPSLTEGVVTVIVEDVYGSTDAFSGTDFSPGFRYVDNTQEAPVITGVDPVFGGVRGGTSVTISGENFINGATVYFDNTPAQLERFDEETGSIVATTPPHAAGQVLVTVRNPDGQENSGAVFDYIPSQPSLTSISPAAGPLAGGTVLSLVGENFDDGALVFIGSRPCLNTVVVNERSVSCVTPGSTSEVTESVEVYVQNPNQLVSGTKTFTYQEPEPDAPVPAITGISPESGEAVGGYDVVITGSGFEPNATLYFAGLLVSPIAQSETEIIVSAPAGQPNSTVQIVVQNSDGQRASRNFIYLDTPPPEPGAPEISSIDPRVGLVEGGTLLTVYGDAFDDTSVVKVGSKICGESSLVSPQIIRCELPSSQTAGAFPVKVVNGELESNAVNFTYEFPPEEPVPAPSITNVSPAFGREEDSVTIVGEYFDENTQVYLGGLVVETNYVSAAELDFVIPIGTTPGLTVLSVQNANGRATINFEVLPDPEIQPPLISSVEPARGQPGDAVNVIGNNFDADVTVFFGSTQAAYDGGAGNLVVQVPEGLEPGLVTLAVQNGDGQRDLFSFEVLAPDEPLALAAIQPATAQAEASTRFFLAGTGFSSAIARVEFVPAETDSPGVSFGPQPETTECADLTILSSTSATCTAALAAAADYTVKLYDAEDAALDESLSITVIPADEGPVLPVIQGLTDTQDATLPVNGAAAGTVIRIQGTDFGIFIDGASAIFNGHVYFGALRVNASPIEPFTDRLEVTVPSGYAVGTSVDLRVVRGVGTGTLQSEPFPFVYQLPTAVVDNVSPTTVNADTPTRLFITGTGFTSDSFASLGIANGDLGSQACQDLTILSETSATCLATLSAFEGAETVYTMTLADSFGGQPTTLGQTLTVQPSDGGTVFPQIISISTPRAVGEVTQITGTDFGIAGDLSFTGKVIFGSVVVPSNTIQVDSETQITALVPAGYAPGAEVEVRVVSPEGLQSAGAPFVYGEGALEVFPKEALLHNGVKLNLEGLAASTITSVAFEESIGEFGEPLDPPVTKTCVNLVGGGGFYSCDLPSPSSAGDVTLTITLDGTLNGEARTIQETIRFYEPSVSQVIGTNGPYGGGTQVTFYGEHLNEATVRLFFKPDNLLTPDEDESIFVDYFYNDLPNRKDINDEMIIVTMPGRQSYHDPADPLAGGIISIQLSYRQDDNGNPLAFHSAPFTYADLGQPAVVAPSTLPVGEESTVLVSLPGVSAIQTAVFKATLPSASGFGSNVITPVSSLVALGDGLFQMTFDAPTSLPENPRLEIVPEGQPVVAGTQLTEVLTLSLNYVEEEDFYDFEYPLSCRDICEKLDDVEASADCGGDSQFQACMTSCENNYFGQASAYPDISVPQCWSKMDLYLNCVMDSADVNTEFQCGRRSWEQGLGANFPEALVGLIGASPKPGGSCESLLTDWESLGCSAEYNSLRRDDFFVSLNTWMSSQLSCERGESRYDVELSESWLSQTYKDSFDRTYIDNGTVQTVGQLAIEGCDSVYENVYTCLADNAANPETVATCSDTGIFFNPEGGACEQVIFKALGVIPAAEGEQDCYSGVATVGGEGIGISYGVDGVVCLTPSVGFPDVMDNDPEPYTSERYAQYETDYGLVCLIGAVNGGGDSFTLTEDVNLVRSVEGYGKVYWQLYGTLGIPAGVTMTVDAGVTVSVPQGHGIVVQTGGTLLTQGTVDAPVVLKPALYLGQDATLGMWGGIIINDAGSVSGGLEITDTVFGNFGGGSSGGVTSRLSYTRIEHAGAELAFNGGLIPKSDEGALTLRGVEDPAGADLLNHVQIHNSGAKSLSLIGGNVNLKRLLITSGSMDSMIRATGAYNGTVSESVLQRYPTETPFSMVEVADEGGDQTFLRLENVTAIAFDDESGSREAPPSLLYSQGGAKLHAVDSVFHVKDGELDQVVFDVDDAANVTLSNDTNSSLYAVGSVVYSTNPFSDFVSGALIEQSNGAFSGLVALVDAQGAPSDAGFVAPTSFTAPNFRFDASAYSPSPGPSTTSQVGAFADATAGSDWTAGWARFCRDGYCRSEMEVNASPSISTPFNDFGGNYTGGPFKVDFLANPPAGFGTADISGLFYNNGLLVGQGPFYDGGEGCDNGSGSSFNYNLSNPNSHTFLPVGYGFDEANANPGNYAMVYRVDLDSAFLNNHPRENITGLSVDGALVGIGGAWQILLNDSVQASGTDAETDFGGLQYSYQAFDLLPDLVSGQTNYLYLTVNGKTLNGFNSVGPVDCTYLKASLSFNLSYLEVSYPILGFGGQVINNGG